MNGAFDNS